jgi:flagellar basal body P-ring formation protein FlgA
MKSLFALATIATASVGTPPALENLDQLDQRVAAFVGSGKSAMALDRRLRLPACNSSAAIEWADVQSLAVRCAAPAWRVRVPLASPEPGLRTESIRALVKRGDVVEARYEADDFDITTYMVAMEDGRKGDAIRVKNPDNGRPSVAVVTDAGAVRFSH